MGCDWSLLQRYTSLSGLAVDSREPLVPSITVRLNQDKHILPFRVHNCSKLVAVTITAVESDGVCKLDCQWAEGSKKRIHPSLLDHR